MTARSFYGAGLAQRTRATGDRLPGRRALTGQPAGRMGQV